MGIKDALTKAGILKDMSMPQGIPTVPTAPPAAAPQPAVPLSVVPSGAVAVLERPVAPAELTDDQALAVWIWSMKDERLARVVRGSES